MAYFSVKTNSLYGQSEIEVNVGKKAKGYAEKIDEVANDIMKYLNTSSAASIRSSLKSQASRLRSESDQMVKMGESLNEVANHYRRTENNILSSYNGNWVNIDKVSKIAGEIVAKAAGDTQDSGWFDVSKVWDMVKKFGPVGGSISLIGGLLSGTYKWNGKGTSKFLSDVVATTGAIAKTAGSWKGWTDLLGVTPKGRISFGQGMKDYIGKFNFGKATNVGGKIAVGCQWAGTALTFITEGFENKEENKDNPDKNRWIKETVGESLVSIGESAAIGAAIGSIIPGAGTVVGAAVTVAGTVIVKWGLDGLSNLITGKDFGEAVSDFVIDTGEKIVESAKVVGKAVVDTAKDVYNGAKKAVGKAAKAVKGAIKSKWAKAKSFFSFA